MKKSKWLTRLLFPPKCIFCGRVLETDREVLCLQCRTEEDQCPASRKKLSFVDGWTAVWYYEGKVRRSLLRYKFYGKRAYGPGFAQYLARKIRAEYPQGFDCLTWVPISSLRKLRRGFDQVELLAEHVGRELGMEPVRLLHKIRHNRPQSRIVGQARRRANVLGAYRAVDPQQIRGKRILLLDDIITTGATVGECARVLLTAGGSEVYCGAVAAAGHRTKDK